MADARNTTWSSIGILQMNFWNFVRFEKFHAFCRKWPGKFGRLTNGDSGHSSCRNSNSRSEPTKNSHFDPKANEHFALRFADGENPCFKGGRVISSFQMGDRFKYIPSRRSPVATTSCKFAMYTTPFCHDIAGIHVRKQLRDALETGWSCITQKTEDIEHIAGQDPVQDRHPTTQKHSTIVMGDVELTVKGWGKFTSDVSSSIFAKITLGITIGNPRPFAGS